MLEDLLRAETYATIAARTHWSVRQIDFAVQALKLVYMPDDLDFPSNNSSTYSRFVALRVAAGLDPCWCEA
jgi:hypothetical protein